MMVFLVFVVIFVGLGLLVVVFVVFGTGDGLDEPPNHMQIAIPTVVRRKAPSNIRRPSLGFRWSNCVYGYRIYDLTTRKMCLVLDGLTSWLSISP